MKKSLLLLISLILLFTLTGCWGKVEINEASTVTGIGFDKSEEGYKVTVQVINYQAFTPNPPNEAFIFVCNAEGKTVFEALRNLTNKFPGKIFLAQIQLMVFSEDVAKEGIKEIIDFFYKHPLSRDHFHIVVLKEEPAESVLRIQTPMKNNPASEVIQIIDSSEQTIGNVHTEFSSDILSKFLSKGIDVTLNGIKITGSGKPEDGEKTDNKETSSPKAKIEASNLAVFKDDKFVGWLSKDQSIGFNIINSTIKTTVIPINYQDEQNLSFEILKQSTKQTFSLEGDKPVISLKIDVSGHLAYPEMSRNAFNKEDVIAIEKMISKQVKELVIDCLKTTQEYQSDIFGFGNLIHRKNKKYWRTIEDDYHEVFSKMEIKVEVQTKLARRAY